MMLNQFWQVSNFNFKQHILTLNFIIDNNIDNNDKHLTPLEVWRINYKEDDNSFLKELSFFDINNSYMEIDEKLKIYLLKFMELREITDHIEELMYVEYYALNTLILSPNLPNIFDNFERISKSILLTICIFV